MPVVQEAGEEPEFLWVQCPQCHEIKPLEHSAEEAPEAASGEQDRRPQAPEAVSLPSRAPAAAGGVRVYAPAEKYQEGEFIHHPGWNDTGKVVGKKESGGGRRMIVVEFEKMGKRKLVMEAEPRK